MKSIYLLVILLGVAEGVVGPERSLHRLDGLSLQECESCLTESGARYVVLDLLESVMPAVCLSAKDWRRNRRVEGYGVFCDPSSCGDGVELE